MDELLSQVANTFEGVREHLRGVLLAAKPWTDTYTDNDPPTAAQLKDLQSKVIAARIALELVDREFPPRAV